MRLRRASLLFVLIGCNSSYAGLSGYEVARSDAARDKILIAEVRQQGQAQAPKAEVTKPESEHNNQPLLELHSQIETLKLDLNKLQGQIEVLVNESELTQKRQKDFYIDLDDRLRRIEQHRGLVDSGSAAPGSTASGSAALEDSETQPGADLQSTPPAPDLSASGAGMAPDSSLPARADMGERGAYEAAYSLFKAGKYENAIARFNEFLKAYPNSNLAPSAQYWIGNAYYALRDFSNAISAQEKLIDTYPDSAKAPDAMLNIASSQQETGERTAAKDTLESVIATYPGSDAAEKAQQRLINLK